jgi:hypothetical protein
MPDLSYQYVKFSTEQGVAVLTPTEPLLRAEAMREALAAVADHDCDRIVLDAGCVRQALGTDRCPTEEPFKPLLDLRRAVRQKGGRLVLCNLSPELCELLRVTWLLRLFELQPDRAAAVAALGPG